MIPSRPFAFAVDVLHYRRGDDATTAGFSYLTAASAKIVQGTKNPERRTFRDFLIQLPYNSGLADLVDVTGEVDHLAPEAPLVVVAGVHLKRLLVYTLPGSAHPHGTSATAPENPQRHNDE